MLAVSRSANESSNKVEAKNINGGTAAVAFTGKKVEFTAEGYATSTNAVCCGGGYTIGQFAGFAPDITGGSYVEEITVTKTSEDFARIRYRVVKRDGLS
jgi:hypothetical protein